MKISGKFVLLKKMSLSDDIYAPAHGATMT